MIRALLWCALGAAAFAAGYQAGIPEEVRPPVSIAKERCRDKLVMARKRVRRAEADAWGTPYPFPDDIDPDFREAGLEERGRRVEIDCPDVAVRFRGVECSEFPCVVLWERAEGASEWECPAWDELDADDRHTSGTARYRDPAGALVELGWEAMWPRGSYVEHGASTLGAAAQRRWQRRVDALLAPIEQGRGLMPDAAPVAGGEPR